MAPHSKKLKDSSWPRSFGSLRFDDQGLGILISARLRNFGPSSRADGQTAPTKEKRQWWVLLKFSSSQSVSRLGRFAHTLQRSVANFRITKHYKQFYTHTTTIANLVYPVIPNLKVWAQLFGPARGTVTVTENVPARRAYRSSCVHVPRQYIRRSIASKSLCVCVWVCVCECACVCVFQWGASIQTNTAHTVSLLIFMGPRLISPWAASAHYIPPL